MKYFGVDDYKIMERLDFSEPHEHSEGVYTGKYLAYINFGVHLVFGKIYDKVTMQLNGSEYVYYRVALYDNDTKANFVIGNYEETWLQNNHVSLFDTVEELTKRINLLSI
jgi:hypothetical protein